MNADVRRLKGSAIEGTESTMTEDRLARLRQVLIKLPRDFQWGWVEHANHTPVRRLTKRAANKFMLACILDYQMNADQAWENARRLAEDVFGDPVDLWDRIGRVSEAQWLRRRQSYRWLHRFPAAHYRVWRIGRLLQDQYGGDAREIWRGQSAEEAHRRLLDLGVGTQLSRMTVGALLDSRHVVGAIDVKADSNVCRVLGRLVAGRTFRPKEATDTARRMSPRNPWRLDAPLFFLGRDACTASPRCTDCSVKDLCTFATRQQHGRSRTRHGV